MLRGWGEGEKTVRVKNVCIMSPRGPGPRQIGQVSTGWKLQKDVSASACSGHSREMTADLKEPYGRGMDDLRSDLCASMAED